MVERTPRLVGEARQAMAAELAGRYHDGASPGTPGQRLRGDEIQRRPPAAIFVLGRRTGRTRVQGTGRETVETSQEADHNDSSNTDEVDGSSGNPEPSGTGDFPAPVRRSLCRAFSALRALRSAFSARATAASTGHRRPTTTTRRTRMKSMVPLGTLSRLAQTLML
jgi:hypothetical protein